MVRVAGLRHAIADGDVEPDLAGLTPAQQLAAIAERAHAMVDALYRLTFDEIMPALATAGVRIVAWSESRAGSSRSRWQTFFRDEILPVLTPLAIDASRPFPLLASLSLNLALLLGRGAGRERAATGDRPGAARSRAARAGRRCPVRSCCSRRSSRAHVALLFPGQPMSGVCRHPSRARLPSWSSTTRAAGRTWSWSSAKCAGGAAATSCASRSSTDASKSSSTLLRTHLEITDRRRLRRARTARPAGVDGPDRSAGARRASRSAASAGRRAGRTSSRRTCSRSSTSGRCSCIIPTTPTTRCSRSWRRRPTIPTCWPSSRRCTGPASDRR